jgi:hypothetical protein
MDEQDEKIIMFALLGVVGADCDFMWEFMNKVKRFMNVKDKALG